MHIYLVDEVTWFENGKCSVYFVWQPRRYSALATMRALSTSSISGTSGRRSICRWLLSDLNLPSVLSSFLGRMSLEPMMPIIFFFKSAILIIYNTSCCGEDVLKAAVSRKLALRGEGVDVLPLQPSHDAVDASALA